MLTKERMLKLAEQQVRKAKIALDHNYHRVNIDKEERQTLVDKYEFARTVHGLIREHYKEA